MKYLIALITLFVTLFTFLTWGFNTANAGEEYNKAVIGHVIQSKANGTNVNVNKLFEQEMQKVAHQYTLAMIGVMQQYLPAVLDGIAADLRLKADNEYKCKLLEDTKIKDDCKQIMEYPIVDIMWYDYMFAFIVLGIILYFKT